jgi:acyl-CoA synthetase (AMP-forming)/AMP-acid ligase II
MTTPIQNVRRASASSVATLFEAQARQAPNRIAIEDGGRTLSYQALAERVQRLTGLLRSLGVGRGDRVAVLSENRAEYLEVFLAAASLGAVVACQNCRLATPELRHCLDLVEPRLALVSSRHERSFAATGHAPPSGVVEFGDDYESQLARANAVPPSSEVDPEDALLILYTSGTTGLPKGAVVSHRAEIFRNLVVRAEFGVLPEDTFVAWSPLYHMGAADCSIGALLSGGKVVVLDGFDRERLVEVIGSEALGWLLLMPGMVAEFA